MHGIIPAILTAYDEHGNVDHGQNARAVEQLIDDGVHGLFVGGSTGESLLQSPQERKSILQTVVDTVRGRIDVIAHVGAMDTRSAVELAEHAGVLGVSAVAALTPLYYSHAPDVHAGYYRALSAVGAAPLIAYHIPHLSGVRLPVSWFVDLADDGVLQGLKYTSTDLFPMVEIRRRTPDDFVLFNGADEVLLAGLALGADGGIGSTYNAIPGVYLGLFDAVRRNDLAAARELQGRANDFVCAMQDFDFISFLRVALEHRGIAMGTSREPLPMISGAQRQAITERLIDLSVVPGVPAT